MAIRPEHGSLAKTAISFKAYMPSSFCSAICRS